MLKIGLRIQDLHGLESSFTRKVPVDGLLGSRWIAFLLEPERGVMRRCIHLGAYAFFFRPY